MRQFVTFYLLFVATCFANAAPDHPAVYTPTAILTVATALLALLGVIVKSLMGDNFKKDLADMKRDLDDFKTEVMKLIEMRDIENKIKTIAIEQDDLYKKYQDLSDKLKEFEFKLNEITKTTHDNKSNRSEDQKRTREDIERLRDSIRDDISEIRNMLMNLKFSIT